MVLTRTIIIRYVCFSFAFFSIATINNAQDFLDPNKQPDQYNFEHWTSDDGLPDNAIIKVIQSRDGYIWFCSYGGITRYNGEEFHTYSSYNTVEIVNNSFTNIYEDNQGGIWAATSGNGIIYINSGAVKAYTTNDGLPSNFVEGFVQDKNGRLWVATNKGLSYKLDDKFVNTGLPEKLKLQNTVGIDYDENNHLWIATENEGVIEFDGDSMIFHAIQSGLLSNRINNIKHQRGKVYVSTKDGLNVIYGKEVVEFTIENGLMDNMVISTELSKNGWLWVGSYQGFSRFMDDEVQYFSKKHPIYGRDITSILEDREGNLWVSTYRGGLFKFWEGKFTNISDYSLEHSEPYTVHTVIQQSDNEFIIVYEEGVSSVNTNTNKFKLLSKGITEFDNKIKCGLIDSKERFWIGTRKGLVLHENNNIELIGKDQGLVNDNIRVVMEDSKGRIWVGTFGGISILDTENNSTSNLTTSNGLSHNYIMHIIEDEKDRIWVGTRAGLNLIENGKVTNFDSDDGLSGEFVFKTFIDSDDVVWILGNAGLTRYKNNVFKPVTTKNGLVSNTLFQIIEDDAGYFWFTTNQKGVSVFKVKKEELNAFCDGKIGKVKSIEYDRSDGIKSSAATSSSTSLKALDGKLWIATQQGVEVINPNEIIENQTPPPVKIEYLTVNDQSVNIDSSIHLPYGKKRIEIGFASLSYRYPMDNMYKYQLIGYDDDWIISKGEMETSYTNLSEGQYTFKVIASNNDGYWNEEGATIKFTIQTPYYRTDWFILLCVAALVGLIWIIYYARIASLKRARMELESIVTERTSEVVQKKEEIETQKEEIDAQRIQIEKQHDELKNVNVELENIVELRTNELRHTYNELLDVNKELDTFIYRAAHDIRGPIARLQGLSDLIQLQTQDANILNLGEMLNRTAEDMNDIFYRLINIVRLKTTELDYEEVNIKEIINDVVKQLYKTANKEECKISIDVNEDLELFSHKETLKVILFQLIDNAYKFRKKETIATIEVIAGYNSENNVVINISDYGVGIDSGYTDKIFEMFYVANDTISSTGLGLYTVKTAVKVLKGDIKIISNALDNEVTTFEVTISNMKHK